MTALTGIRVLDVTGMGAASVTNMMLGDMGAEVIKIDMLPGKSNRGVGQGMNLEGVQVPSAWNRNKRSMALDLKTEAGKNVFHKLARTADVIVESFRPGVMDRLGLGYRTISQINPKIVFCSISGYGQDGPYRDLPGHDANYAGMGGVLGLIGDRRDRPPVLALNIVADVAVAIHQAVIGILLALLARNHTGRGQLVDISMTDGVVFLLTAIPQAGEYLRSGIIPQRGEMMLSGNEPYCAVYETKDNKYITVSPLEPHFWQNMCHALEREDLAPHQFAPSPKKEEIFNELKQNFQTRTRDEWFELLTKADVPVGKVLDLEEVFTDPHVLHRQMVLEIDDPELGRVKEIGLSIKLSDTPGQVRTLAPRLGQHTDEILSDLGYSQVEIEHLHSERIIHS